MNNMAETQAPGGVSDEEVQNCSTSEDPKNNTRMPGQDPLSSFSEVFMFARTAKVRWMIGVGLFFSIISGSVFPAMSFFFAEVFEDLAADPSASDFLRSIRELAFSFMILGVIAFVSMTLQTAFLETAAGEMSRTMKEEWFQALLRQDMAYYDIKDVSGTSTIISTNGAKYKKGMGKKFGEGFQYGVTFLGGLGYAFWSSYQVSLLILAVAPFMAISTAMVLNANQTKTARANASYAKAGSIVYTAVSSIRTVLALNAVETIIDMFVSATQEAYDGAASFVSWVGLANGAMMGSFLLSYVPVTLFGAWLIYDNVMKSGCDPSGSVPGNDPCSPSGVGVFGALMGVTFAGAVLPQVSSTLEAFTGARSAAYPALVAIHRRSGRSADSEEKIASLERRGSVTPLPKYVIDSSSSEGLKPCNVRGDIEFRGVCFCYPTRQESVVFNEFSLKVPAGKTLALVGSSGSGKSTTMHLLERFYDPTDGVIELDGLDLRKLNVTWLRRQIGFVSQEPKLFATTIRRNIEMGLPGATNEQVEDAARKANAHDFIVSFPQGYDTQVGDQGTQLSGGQKQRIAIARVLIKNPRILLLDEATSALDSESEALVQAAIDKLIWKGSQTVIVIAHRLSTIYGADLIAVVHSGKVVEIGSHESLLEQGGKYFDLVQAQKSPNVAPPILDATSRVQSGNLSQDSSCTEDDATPGTDGPILEFRNVRFSYPARPSVDVFRGLNLSISEGETLALVGPSGHGKSTILQLCENFYLPTEGSLCFRGIDFKDYNVAWLRKQIGLVSQEPTLFDMSVAENISFGLPHSSQEDIEQAARDANAHDFIMEFPEQYRTQVGNTSSLQISGGQKQRIAIARALLRSPTILLLDEATSALDSVSEKLVQAAIERIMSDTKRTTIVIAHRLSTIAKASKIAVIEGGKVREMGTHSELMQNPSGRYRRLQALQNLDEKEKVGHEVDDIAVLQAPHPAAAAHHKKNDDETIIGNKDAERARTRRARAFAQSDRKYFLVGSTGAALAGLMFPGWGFVFAYMIELLYTPVLVCDSQAVPPVIPGDFASCSDYWNSSAKDMQGLSFDIFYGILGVIFCAVAGNTLLFYGFGTATEKMNKRVRDATFRSLVRQEVAWFDVRAVGAITSQISDDAALVHAFSGEPIRTLVLNLASVFVGLVVSFVYMWPFALVFLAILPFMAFGAEAEMQMYLGEDEGDSDMFDENSSGGIVVESLLNIRTVASMTIESERLETYHNALLAEDPNRFSTNFVKGSTAGLGQFVQMWGIALLFWWGGWLLACNHGICTFSFRDYLVSMFSLLFSLSGMGFAMQGITDRDKANRAADRIFSLIDRESAIDPLSNEGRKGT